MAMNLAQNFVDPILDSILRFLKEQADLCLVFEEKIVRLESELPQLKMRVLNAEAPNLPEKTRELLADLKVLFYDYEDILDEFKTESDRRRWLEEQQQPSSLPVQQQQSEQRWICDVIGSGLVHPYMQMVCRFLPFSCLGGERDVLPLSLKLKMANQMKMCEDIRKNIQKKMKPTDLESFVDGVLPPVSGGELAESSHAPSGRDKTDEMLIKNFKLVGREEKKRHVMKDLLLGPNPELSVVLIHGMGGMGKTTLARVILNEARSGGHFRFTKWVFFGEGKLDPEKVRGQILGEDRATKEKIRAELGNKRCLIVMDDAWKENLSEWFEELWTPLSYAGSGSRVIITTRQVKDLVKKMRKVSTTCVGLDKLGDDDCLKILMGSAFPNGKDPSFDRRRLEYIGGKIVKKLGGLPLAAEVIGSSLRGETVDIWKDALENIHDIAAKTDDGSKDIMSVFWWSYRRLPPHLKQCFAYLSLFPKDARLHKERIALMWMAQNYVLQAGHRTLEKVGEGYLDDLVKASLIQEIDDEYVMHDLIHDFAVHIAGDEYMGEGRTWAEIKQPQVLHHLMYFTPEEETVDMDSIHSPVIPQRHLLSKMKKLRTYISDEPSLLDIFNDKLATVRVMQIDRLREEIVLERVLNDKMHLRFLDLSKLDIYSLPDSLCDLYNLQTLLVPLRLNQFPMGMWKLVNLRHLIGGQKMPCVNRMGELTSLQTISSLGGNCIRDLRNLSQLRGELRIYHLGLVRDGGDAEYAQLDKKEHLADLQLVMNGGDINDDLETGQNDNLETQHLQVLDGLRPNRNLEKLNIGFYCGRELPTWIGGSYLTELASLVLSFCKSLKKLPPLGRLPNLQYLKLEFVDGLEHIGQEIYGTDPVEQVFPSLKELRLRHMSNLVEWEALKSSVDKGKINYFPCLESIKVTGCPKLRCLPQVPRSLSRFSIGNKNTSRSCNLPEIWECCNDGDEEDTPRGSLLPCLEDLNVEGCSIPNVNKWLHHAATSLSEIALINCVGPDRLSISSLQRLKEIKLDNFSSLKKVVVQDCPNLNIMSIDYLPLLESMELQNLSSLDSLSLRDYPYLKTLSVVSLHKIQELALSNMPSLEELDLPPNLTSLEELKVLDLSELPSLEIIELLDHNSLSTLIISSLLGLRKLVLQNLASLKEFGLCGNRRLSEIQLARMPSLTMMYMEGCEALTSITGLRNLTALKKIVITGTWKFQLTEDDDKDALKNLSLLVTDSRKFLEAVDPRTLGMLELGMSEDMYSCSSPEETRLKQWWQNLDSISEIIIYQRKTERIPCPAWMDMHCPHLQNKITFNDFEDHDLSDEWPKSWCWNFNPFSHLVKEEEDKEEEQALQDSFAAVETGFILL